MIFVDEERLFKKIPFFFSEPGSILIEIVQNAVRARANKVDIKLDNSILEVCDDGDGTDNIQPLLVLARSDWDSETEKNQNPAGWGLYFLLCLSDKVYLQSKFGSITIHSNAFLNDREYRESLTVNAYDNRSHGFYIRAVLKEGIQQKIIDGGVKNLCYFPLNITFNGETVERVNIDDEYKSYPIKTFYKGNNKVFICPEMLRLYDCSDFKLKVIWYGIPIPRGPRELYWSDDYPVIIDVREGDVLTPVLPYREGIQKDKKFEEFNKFVRALVVDYCIEKINSGVEDMQLIHIMEKLATQEELNMLKRFPLKVTQYYYNTEYDGESEATNIYVDIDSSPLVNEIVQIEGVDTSNHRIVLPQNSIVSVEVPEIAPYWVKNKVVDRKYTIKVTPIEEFRNNMTWYKAKIECDGKEIKIIAMVYGNVKIYYTEDPKQFFDIEPAVFTHLYYENGDSWDTQEYEFNNTVREDIKKLKKDFTLNDLLGGLLVADINPFNVREIKINSEEKRITIKTIEGEDLKITFV